MIIHIKPSLFRGILFALLWLILVDGNLDSWPVGAPVVLLSTVVSLVLLPPSSWSLVGALRFVPFFILHSLRGGGDVAWRALHPGMPINPEFVDYPMRLAPGIPRILVVTIVNLLPGTLSVGLSADRLKVHSLNGSPAILAELFTVEQNVAQIFGISLQSEIPGEGHQEV